MDSQFQFNILEQKPFLLKDQSKTDLNKIKDECIDKVTTWDRRMSSKFFPTYFKGADSWRIKPTDPKNRTKQLFNSKSGETHRGAETLATLWHRMIFANDPPFEAIGQGLDSMGLPVSEEDIYATEGVLLEQQKAAEVKRKFLRTLRSLATFGVVTVENPFVSKPYGFGRKNMEYTDWGFRPMTRVPFDTAVYDMRESDFIATIDFISKYMLRNIASLDAEWWDMEVVERHIKDFGKGGISNSSMSSRLKDSRSRAGYYDVDAEVYENINYHGRLDHDNSVIQNFANYQGVDPKFVDWSVGILDESEICKFHMTQYGDWRTRFLTATYKEFEDEPLGYGIAQIGRRLQRDMDINESMTNDLLTAFTLMMMKVGKYAGYSEKQMVLEPLKIFELEDINQMAPLTPDPAAFKVALEMINLRREDFRNIIGAQTNLQAQITGASATESGIAQTEAIRGAGVHAELIGEMYRQYLEISHINNLNYLDEPIWVGLTGAKKPMLVDKNMLPINVGFKVKISTDKDFRPERMKVLTGLLQIEASIRSFIEPEISVNAIRELHHEIWRNAGMNPRALNQPITPMQRMESMAGRMPGQNGPTGQGGQPADVQGEQASLGQPGGGEMATPVGPVPTSPIGPSQQTDMSAIQ